ncbi:hypothetical protein VT84_36485 [Gemmata sp. SH-PL17]|uniref:hypothetical protein n=1 Tax=Gemmata sp. SH-PL17 TaxID=1630693 RepID=UPI00078C0D25|nr:hypothetical protein [Gemmata sp. SH-PL17]AMV29948.1 hypothetical protein VT84_36485 [Gemmata sp. SH-PL17]
MSIVLSLTGQLELAERLSRTEARDWLARAAVWFEGIGDAVLDARVVRDGEERPVLLLVLHPAAPAAEVRLGASGRLRVSAVTEAAGPGYHIYLCDLFRQMADEFEFAWVADDCVDPTGYFHSRGRGACERFFLQWLAEQCATNSRSIGLPASHGFTYPADLLTPLGPRTRAWAAEVAAHLEKGRDFFAWWNPALDSIFYRGRALVRMWLDFFWRPPLSEADGELADQIANDLASAFKLDPAAELPWAEWLELLTAIAGDEDGYCVTPNDDGLSIELWKHMGPLPAPAAKDRIGYRRYPVRVSLDGSWSVEIPGELARERNDDRTWTAWDRTRTVWFHPLRFTKPGGEPPTAAETAEVGRKSLPEGEALPGFDRDGLRGEAVFGPVEEDGRTLWRLSGVIGAPGQLAVCNVYIENESDRDWAVRTWRSLRPGG